MAFGVKYFEEIIKTWKLLFLCIIVRLELQILRRQCSRNGLLCGIRVKLAFHETTEYSISR